MPITDQAVCLRRSDYSETSLVVRLMTREHGQVSLMAKGVKRPKSRFGGSIDLLTIGQAVFTMPRECSVSTMGILTAWDQTVVFARLRTDLLRHAVAMTAGELLARLTEELDPHPAGFDAIIELLRSLEADEPPVRRLAQFGRSLLADVGLTPNFERCVACGLAIAPGRGALRFSGPRAGVLCHNCVPAPNESTTPVSDDLKDFFTHARLTSGKLALEIVRWLLYHVQHQIGRPLNSAENLERAIRAAIAAHAASRNR